MSSGTIYHDVELHYGAKPGTPSTLPNQALPRSAIKYQAATGPSVMVAKLLEFSDEGISVELASLLSAGLSVEIVGDIEGAAGSQWLRRRGFVRRCSAAGNGR